MSGLNDCRSQVWLRYCSSACLFLCLFAIVLGTFTVSAIAGTLTVTLRDAKTSAVLPGHKVVAYQLDAENQRQWRKSLISNENGIVGFELDELGSGGRFVVAATVYNGFKVYSDVMVEPGQLELQFGSTQVQVLNGSETTKPPLANTKIYVYQYSGDSKSWFASVFTDDAGRLKIDLPKVDAGQQYILGGASPVSGQSKYSEPITRSGEHQFTLGNLPLNVALVDGLSAAPIANQRIDVYQLDNEGKKHWYTRGESDAQGQVSFDLAGLGSGSNYLLRTKLFNDASIYSSQITAPGSHQFRVGTTELTLLNGAVSPNTPLAGYPVYFRHLLSDGSTTYFAKLYTTDSGTIRLNLPGLGQGQHYQVKAKSPTDGSTYYQKTISSEGQVTLVAGSQPLTVKLQDALTGQGLADKKIWAYSVAADGSRHKVASTISNNQGIGIFDLPELSTGANYQLATYAFGDFKSYSDIVTTSGEFDFKVGAMRVQLRDGSQNGEPPLSNSELTILKVEGDKNTWFSKTLSDAQGVVRLDLPGIEQGVVYRLRAHSPVNGANKYSALVNHNGDIDFVVGNPAVSVRLFNLLTHEVYGNEAVSAYQVDSSGGLHWYNRLNTDENGVVLFDLDNIDQGQQYLFKVYKFATGSSYSDTVTAAGAVEFGIGAVPMQLLDKDTLQTMAGLKVTAYLIRDNGQLVWTKSGVSDAQGQLTFDLPGLAQGQRYTFKADNPFGENKRYYGPVINSIGAIIFNLKKGERGELDLTAPAVTIDLPAEDHANSTGFVVAGEATDNQAIDRVELTVGNHSLTANWDNNSNRWQAQVPGSWLTVGESVTITAKAFDRALNNSVVSKRYLINVDIAPPQITLTSHQNGDSVNVVGFTVMGEVSDDIGVESIKATLIDPILGATIADLPLNVSSLSGQWALVVTNGKVSKDQTVLIQLQATDLNGKTADLELQLNTQAVSFNQLQLAQRITFGVTPDLLMRLKQGEDYLAEQLNPDSIDDSVFESQMAQLNVVERQDLRDYLLRYMTGSKKQLREVMAWFWENHFNTSINTHQNVAYELAENQGFRAQALGRFRDLLEVSAKSPAMIRYLNNAQNVAGNANENYAREIMELHTLGVDGGYTAQDIAELSRIFTGWHESEGAFLFNPQLHDSGDKTFLGNAIAGGGVEEGEQVLDILASHPNTAYFICGKLINLFVSDQPATELQQQCSAQFLAVDGQMSQVLPLLLRSDEFVATQNFRGKLKTPVELVVATMRGFNSQLSTEEQSSSLREMGMQLFEFPAPTGFSELAEDWLNSNAVVQRLRLANTAAMQTDLRSLLVAEGYSSAEAIVGYLFDLAMAGEFSDLEYQLALSVLNQDQPFDFNANDADEKLTRLLRTVMSLPGYQYQ